jgi:NADPH:quinone reductase-like Zn-dependent oxidoreductase
LINGAGGVAGTFAVQIAKSFGAVVTGVDRTSKLDMMRSIGADQIIDYTREDFTKNGQRYDLILDFAAHHSIFDCKRTLSLKGIYVMIGGSTALMFHVLFLGPWVSLIGSKKMSILAHKPNKGLVYLKELFEAGKFVPVIDRRYPLSEVPEALRYFGKGHARGKVVMTLEHNNKTKRCRYHRKTVHLWRDIHNFPATLFSALCLNYISS